MAKKKKVVSRRVEPARAARIGVHPLEDRVLIEPSEAEEKTAGGIVLPDTAKEKPQRGTVVAVGPGRLLDTGRRVAVAVSVGDQVVYGKYTGNEIKVGTRKLVICREGDILGVLEK